MIVLECQGSVMEMTDLTVKGTRPRVAHKRGRVRGFSAGSRRRMINFVSRLNLKGQRSVFLTLTFKGTPSAQEAKRALKQFVMRLRRAHPKMAGIWRAEMQERGSPHYHLILFNMPFVPHADLRKSWMECTGEENSGLHITLMRNPEMTMRYVSKYVAKTDKRKHTLFINASYQHEGENHDYEGRAWGWINLAAMPLAELLAIQVLCADEAAYFWWCAWARAGRKFPPYWGRCSTYLQAAVKCARDMVCRGSGSEILSLEASQATLENRKAMYSDLRMMLESIG